MSKLSINQRGFGLIEVMVTIAIISIGIAALVEIFPLSLKVGKSAEENTIAANLAQAKIEEAFSLGYDNLTVGTMEAKHRLSADSQNPFYHYQRQTVVEYVNESLDYSEEETGLKKITVTVFWDTPLSANEKILDIKILIAKTN